MSPLFYGLLMVAGAGALFGAAVAIGPFVWAGACMIFRQRGIIAPDEGAPEGDLNFSNRDRV